MARRQLKLLEASFSMLLQFGLIFALNVQLFGMVVAFQMLEHKRNLAVAAYVAARKSYRDQKLKHLRARQLRRRRRSVWVINGRTDQWWENMIGADVPDWCWRKNFRMSKDCFYELTDELRTQRMLIAIFTGRIRARTQIFSPG